MIGPETSPAATLAEPPAVPQARLWPLFCFGLVALDLIWLPMAVLVQIDALLAFMTLRELGRDVALLFGLLAIFAIALTVASTLVASLSRRFGIARGASNNLAWVLVGLPIAMVCAWQFAFGVKHWMEVFVSDHRVATSPLTRVAMVVVVLLALAMMWRRLGTTRLVRAVVEPLLELRPLALLATAAALVFLVLHPPGLQGSSTAALSMRPTAPIGAPDIFLISIDALAASDAAVCGDGPTPMPRLRQLAALSTCFSRFYSSSNFTNPTTSTMDTGVLPWSHWAVQIGARIAAPLQAESAAKALQAAGYSTHSISANLLASPRHHGSYRGYDTVDITPSTSLRTTLRETLTVFPDSSLPLLIYAVSSFLSTIDIYLHGDRNPYDPELVYQALPPLLDRTGHAHPVFAWLHTLPPHAPYLPPKTTKYRLLPTAELDTWREFLPDNLSYGVAQQSLVDKHRLRYRESIMGADEALGRFIDTLEKLGRLDNAVVIVTADHGESFEHGFLGHAGNLLHDALIRVPLIVKLPGQKAGRVINTPVSQADLAPTVLDLAGAKALPHAEGRSLRAALTGQTLASLPVFAMTFERQSRFRPINSGSIALIEDRYKLVHDLAHNRSYLFDLLEDPGEQYDIALSRPEVTNRLRNQIRQRINRAESARFAQFGK